MQVFQKHPPWVPGIRGEEAALLQWIIELPITGSTSLAANQYFCFKAAHMTVFFFMGVLNIRGTQTPISFPKNFHVHDTRKIDLLEKLFDSLRTRWGDNVDAISLKTAPERGRLPQKETIKFPTIPLQAALVQFFSRINIIRGLCV